MSWLFHYYVRLLASWLGFITCSYKYIVILAGRLKSHWKIYPYFTLVVYKHMFHHFKDLVNSMQIVSGVFSLRFLNYWGPIIIFPRPLELRSLRNKGNWEFFNWNWRSSKVSSNFVSSKCKNVKWSFFHYLDWHSFNSYQYILLLLWWSIDGKL